MNGRDRLLEILNEDLAPWKFTGEEPMTLRILALMAISPGTPGHDSHTGGHINDATADGNNLPSGLRGDPDAPRTTSDDTRDKASNVLPLLSAEVETLIQEMRACSYLDWANRLEALLASLQERSRIGEGQHEQKDFPTRVDGERRAAGRTGSTASPAGGGSDEYR